MRGGRLVHPAYYYSYRWYRLRSRFRPGAVLILLIIIFFILINYLATSSPTLAKCSRGLLNVMMSWSERDPRGILRVGVPVMAWAGNQEDIPQVVSPGDLMAPLVRLFRMDPQQMMESEIPLLAGVAGLDEALVPTIGGSVFPDLFTDEELETPPVTLSKESLVAIYNTHTGETYALTDGMDRLTGKRGGVVKVAEALEQELEQKYGVRVARSDAINDIHYSTSYTKSQEVLQKLLEDNPAVQVVIDIHRDAGKSRENSLVSVDGQLLAPVLIIVGSDARSPFPTWRQNYSFAQELAAQIDKQHPGLCLGVRIKEGRYNQFLHSRAVLLEMGSVANSTEEAVRSARLLAGPVAELVKRCMDDE